MSSWKWKGWNSILMYNPNSGNVRSLGLVFFFFFLWKLKWFQITWANILFTIEHREHNKCLNWDILKCYAQNELIWNLMPTTGLKIIGMGASLPRCSISSSFQNSLKTSGHLGCDFLEFWCWNLVPFLSDIGFQLLESSWSPLTYFSFNDVPNVLYR